MNKELLTFHLLEKDFQLSKTIPILKKQVEVLKELNQIKYLNRCKKILNLFELYSNKVNEIINRIDLYYEEDKNEAKNKQIQILSLYNKTILNYSMENLFPFIKKKLLYECMIELKYL